MERFVDWDLSLDDPLLGQLQRAEQAALSEDWPARTECRGWVWTGVTIVRRNSDSTPEEMGEICLS